MLILRKPFVGPGGPSERVESLIREVSRIVDELNLELAARARRIDELSKAVKTIKELVDGKTDLYETNEGGNSDG